LVATSTLTSGGTGAIMNLMNEHMRSMKADNREGWQKVWEIKAGVESLKNIMY